MVRIVSTVFAGLLGLAFGSFLNVCLSRWPEGESIVKPRSHCRSCNRTLAWWENVPLVSWIALRGRCKTCHAEISWRYPLVELAVGSTWAVSAWQQLSFLDLPGWTRISIFDSLAFGVVKMILCWLLIALAVLDAEYLWLPDRLTLGGAVIGVPISIGRFAVHWIWATIPLHWDLHSGLGSHRAYVYDALTRWILGILALPALILLTRWAYKQIRRHEGIGLGDAKLTLMLATWLGLSHTVLALVLGFVLGFIVALVILLVPGLRKSAPTWATIKLPMGMFLCVGGIISALWGGPMIRAYLDYAGL
jgi:leader peptidase (prepilin peptidase)/N-methyltransferase